MSSAHAYALRTKRFANGVEPTIVNLRVPHTLNRRGIRTASGTQWHAMSGFRPAIVSVCDRPGG
jgi:hypothetical protein